MRRTGLFVLLLSGFLYAQTTIVDKVVARVGDEVITLSELNELYENYKNLYPNMSEEDLKNSILQELINNKLILQAAKKDKTIAKPRPEEINQVLEERIKYFEQQYGTENFENMLKSQGLTRESLKEMYRENIADRKSVV